MTDDERLRECFLNGMAIGMGTVTICFVVCALLLPVMFF